jgi:hypothetical protein
VPKKKSKTKENSPGALAAEHLQIRDLAKQGYKTADSALDLLISKCRGVDCPTCGAPRFKNDGVVKGSDGRRFRIVDKFASRNSVPVGQNARRFELEEIH